MKNTILIITFTILFSASCVKSNEDSNHQINSDFNSENEQTIEDFISNYQPEIIEEEIPQQLEDAQDKNFTGLNIFNHLDINGFNAKLIIDIPKDKAIDIIAEENWKALKKYKSKKVDLIWELDDGKSYYNYKWNDDGTISYLNQKAQIELVFEIGSYGEFNLSEIKLEGEYHQANSHYVLKNKSKSFTIFFELEESETFVLISFN